MAEQAKHESNESLKKSIVGLFFHPFYQNHICVLQEGGDIHMIDATNGVISHTNLAKAKINSSWACDPYEMQAMVVGDVGRACLFDISMNAKVKGKNSTMRPGVQTRPSRRVLSSQKQESVVRYNSPPKYAKGGRDDPIEWQIKKDWFVAHKIHKMEPAYVVVAKFVQNARVYVTGTTHGEVRLWDNLRCDCLGTLNSCDWDPSNVLSHVKQVKELVAEQERAERGSKQSKSELHRL